MNIQEFRQLIETYGTNSDVWPPDQKQEALALLQTGNRGAAAADAAAADAAAADAAAVITEFEPLDKLLDADIVDDSPALKLSILNKIHHLEFSKVETSDFKNTNPDLLAKLWHWLAPSPNGLFFIWRPAMAACIPLLAGVYLGTIMDTSANETAFEWEEDIYVMGLVTEIEEEE